MTAYTCSRCGLVCKSMKEHISHLTSEHDRGYVKRTELTRMAISCWRCAAMMEPAPDHVYRCTCGFSLAENFKDTLVIEQQEKTDDEQ